MPTGTLRSRGTKSMVPFPLPDAIVDTEKKISTVEISLGSLRQNLNPAENILLQPYDQISVGRAELVYVNGEVSKVGGVELGERDSISIAQVLSQTGGFTRDAKKSKVRILRPVEGTSRRYVIEVDVARPVRRQRPRCPPAPRRHRLRSAFATTASSGRLSPAWRFRCCPTSCISSPLNSAIDL